METTQPFLLAQSIDSSSNQQQTKESAVIDIEELIKDSKDNPCCIYRVPPMIRKLNKDAYTPMAVSIGPFHYGEKGLRDMEEYKQALFERFKEEKREGLDKMVSTVKDLEPKVRASYSENIKLDTEDFMKLVLVDAVFIIKLFRSSYDGQIRKDGKLSRPYLKFTIINDLLLLENQLPFFLIEELFNSVSPRDQGPSFLELTFHYFGSFNQQNLKPNPNRNPDDKIKHFTDLLRSFYLPPNPQHLPERKSIDGGSHLHYNANELQDAGVKFKLAKNNYLFGLSFSGRDLEIPEIIVEDNKEFLFRNVIALEHCHYPFQSYIIDYALAMDCLINSDKDVDVLVHKNIIRNWLGDSNEVATLFNGLGKNILTLSCSCEYLEIFKGLNEFYENKCHKRMASLKRDYCNTPWKTVATYVGIIVLILTVTQSIISISQVII